MDILDQIETLPASGTERVDALIGLAITLPVSNPQQSLAFFAEAESLARELAYTHGLAEALWHRGKSKSIITRPDDSFEDYFAALELFEQLGDAHGRFKTCNSLAIAYGRLGNFTESGRYYEQALELCSTLDNKYNHQVVLRNLALTFDKRGEYKTAISYLEESLKMARESDNPIEIALNLLNIGEIHYSLADYTHSLEILLEAALISQPFEHENLYLRCLASIGSIYVKLGKMTSALDYLQQLLHRAEQDGNKTLQAKAMFNIGYIYNKLGSTSSGLTYYLKCLRICEQANDRFGEAETLHSLAEFFLQLGDHTNAFAYARKSLQLCRAVMYREIEITTLHTLGLIHKELKEYTEARSFMTDALALAEELSTQEYLLDIHNNLAAVYKKAGDNDRSKHHAKEYKQLARRHFSEEEKKKALGMIRKFEDEKSRREVEEWGISFSKHEVSDDVFIAANKAEFESASTAPDIRRETKFTEPAAKEIQVSTFGRFAVNIEGRELTAEDWQRKKARDIFKVLLINYRKAVSIDELIDLLWGDSSGKSIIPTIWNSVSYIRKALEPNIKAQTPSSFIKIIDKSYMLDLGDDAVIDFLQFRSLIDEAQRARTDTTRIGLMEQAVALYTGDFLREDTYEEWSCFERESLKNLYLEALIEIASWYREKGNNDKALVSARKAVEADRTYEEGYEIIIDVLMEGGQAAEAQKVMRQCRDAFEKELASAPPRYLEDLLK